MSTGDGLGEADALGDREGDSLADGLRLAEGLADAEGLMDGLSLALGLIEADGLTEAEGETDADGETLGDADTDGDTLAEGETEGDTEALGDLDAEGLTLALGDTDGLALAEGEASKSFSSAAIPPQLTELAQEAEAVVSNASLRHWLSKPRSGLAPVKSSASAQLARGAVTSFATWTKHDMGRLAALPAAANVTLSVVSVPLLDRAWTTADRTPPDKSTFVA